MGYVRALRLGLVLVFQVAACLVAAPPAWTDDVPPPEMPRGGDELPAPVGEDENPLPDRLLGPGRGEAADGPEGRLPLPGGGAPPPPTLPDDLRRDPGSEVEDPAAPELRGTDPGTASPLDLWSRRDPRRLAARGVAWPRRSRSRLHGSVRMRYRGRVTGDGKDDHDLYEYLTLSYGSEYAPGWFAQFDGRLGQDLDEFGRRGGFDVFESIDDTYDDRLTGRLYTAYVGFRTRRGTLEEVRLGRQYVDAGELFHVDGLRVAFRSRERSRGLRVQLFAGAPAHVFEGSLRGLVAGAGVEADLGPQTTGSIDYVHIRDHGGFYGSVHNNLITAELRRRFGRAASLWARYSHLNGRPNRLDVVWNGWFPQRDVTLRARFRTLLSAQDALAFGLDPYFAIVQALQPYYEAAASAAKAFGRWFYVEGGAAGRWLHDDADEGRYNREFQRFHLTAGSEDWPSRHLHLGLTGEIWTGDDVISTVAFDVTWEPSRRWRFVLGSDYQLYRTEFVDGEERIDSRSVFFRVRWRGGDRWQAHARVRWERDDFDTYWILDMGVGFRF